MSIICLCLLKHSSEKNIANKLLPILDMIVYLIVQIKNEYSRKYKYNKIQKKMSKSQNNIVNILRNYAVKKCPGDFKHAAALVRNNKIYSMGFCSPNRTYIGGKIYSSCHAEILCLHRHRILRAFKKEKNV